MAKIFLLTYRKMLWASFQTAIILHFKFLADGLCSITELSLLITVEKQEYDFRISNQ